MLEEILKIIVSVKTTNKNIGFYKKLNSKIKSGDIINVSIKDLSKGSKQKIDVSCKCGILRRIYFKTLFRLTKGLTEDLYCNKCKIEKTRKTNLQKYGTENFKKTQEEYIKQANVVHNNFYDYSKTQYVNSYTKVEIRCPKHNKIFFPKAQAHLSGLGCSICGRERQISKKILGKERYIKKANKIHNNKYIYDRVNYIDAHTKIEVGCPIHGYFFQRPMDHTNSKQGCPICKDSKGEKVITTFLIENNIKYEHQKSFPGLKHKNLLYFDFYLTELNICIEFDGEQHYRISERWGGEKQLEIIQLRDKLKTDYCEKNKIKLIRIKYNEDIEKKLKENICL